MYIDEYITEVNGHELLLRNARSEDADMLIAYLKTVCEESKFLVKEPEEITFTPEEEQNFIASQNESPCNLMLLGFLDGEYVGNCSFSGNSVSRFHHRAGMGIALYQKYTGMGIGGIMIERLLETAKKIGIEQMELEVAADNERAISLYRKLGFEVFGTFPDNMKYKDGSYADAYWMMKKL